MKRIATLFSSMLIFSLLMTACGNNPEGDFSENSQDITLVERIQKATTYDEITSCYSYMNYKKYSKVEKDALKERVFEYILSNQKLNGIYYYNQKFLDGTLAAKKYGLHSKDTIAVYIAKSDEVYFVPEQELNGIDINDIPSMENSNEYMYKAVDGTACDTTWLDGPNMSIDFVRLSDNYEIHIKYREDVDYITVYDCFPHQLDEEGAERTSGIRDYYLDESKSLSASQTEYDELEQKREDTRELSKSEPKVGMTASEVRASVWGWPDKVNSDTYSWGTTEQWVYNDKGYVYFKNGVVTSVSKR